MRRGRGGGEWRGKGGEREEGAKAGGEFSKTGCASGLHQSIRPREAIVGDENGDEEAEKEEAEKGAEPGKRVSTEWYASPFFDDRYKNSKVRVCITYASRVHHLCTRWASHMH